MNFLVIAAHPDDEVLGAGGLASRLRNSTGMLNSVILSGNAEARKNRPELTALKLDIERAHQILGLGHPTLGHFPNIQFNTVPHIELVQFIEAAIQRLKPDVVLTHHPNDLNDDHRQTSLACQAAVRLFQRGADVPRLKGFYFMEILSATDWSFPSANEAFKPDTFLELGEEHLKQKIRALEAYRGVLRPFPHSRSKEILQGLAAYRGGQAGMQYAEAYQTAFQDLSVLLP